MLGADPSPAGRASALRARREPEVNHVGRRDRLHEGEVAQVADAVEQSLTAAEEYRRDVKLHLVDEAGVEVLLRDFRAPRQRDILPARSTTCLLEGALDPVGD